MRDDISLIDTHMNCSKCRREAIIYQRYSGMHLCQEHFTESVESRVKREIRKHGWVKHGDTIGVALSGGKDSTSLLHFLTNTFGDRPDITILAITIDEGIAGYRNMSDIKEIAERYGVPWHTTSFAEEYGITLDGIVVGQGDDRRSCSFCGVLRRRVLNRLARETGCTKIAFGFNLDDEAQSVMMNVLRGDTERLTMPQRDNPGMIPRIRPFAIIPEREIALYAHLHVGPLADQGCPYAHNALRGDVRRLLNEYTWLHPATKHALRSLGEDLQGRGAGLAAPPNICPKCGEPAFGTCRTCAILSEVKQVTGNEAP